MGAMYPAVPAGCASPTVNGTSGDTWFRPLHGADGIYYQVVPTP
jgi:hypothetical protein